MPNLTFMTVQFFHLTALALWVGGIVGIGIVAAPSIFKLSASRTLAGEIVGNILEKFGKLTLACMVVLAITSLIKYSLWETKNPWILTRYGVLLLMAAATIFSNFVVSPKMAAIKEKLGSFDTTQKEDPLRVSFNNYHKVSSSLMLLSLACGLLALFLA
ncbi:MAG: DUF4149 domain-containing protein [Nitrospinota bacterium]